MVGDLVGYVKGTLLGTKNIDKKLFISLYLGQEPSLVCTYIRTRRVIFSVIFFIYFHGDTPDREENKVGPKAQSP